MDGLDYFSGMFVELLHGEGYGKRYKSGQQGRQRRRWGRQGRRQQYNSVGAREGALCSLEGGDIPVATEVRVSEFL